MWKQTNERFLDRRGCGDEFFIDADFKASAYLAELQGDDSFDDSDNLDEHDDAPAH